MNSTSEIQKILSSLIDQKSDHDRNAKFRKVSSELLLLIIQGKNVMPFLSHIIQMLPSNDLHIKRFCNLFIKRFKYKVPDLSYLVSNTLQKDCADPNPLVRSLSLQTFCSIPTLVEYSEDLISQGLQDNSGYVRRSAVQCCNRVTKISPTLVFDKGFVDELYSMLRDKDPIVIANCLTSLEEILVEEGGVVVNKNIANHLLGILSSFTEWNLIHVFTFLCKYSPKSEEEIVEIIKKVEPYFMHSNPAVCLAAIQLLLHVVNNPDFKTNPLLKIQSHISSFLVSSDPETTFVLLDFIEYVISFHPGAFTDYYKNFYCYYNDPLKIKMKKIHLLPRFIHEENVTEILNELQNYAVDISLAVGEKAIESIGKTAVLYPQHLKLCIEKLFHLLEYGQKPLCDQVLSALQLIELPKDFQPELLAKLSNCNHSLMSSEGRSCLLWLLGEYCGNLNNSIVLLDEMIKYWNEEVLTKTFKHNLLTAAVKLFLYRPSEGQYMLGQIMELCNNDDDLSLQDRVKFYYYLMKTDINLMKQIVINQPASSCSANSVETVNINVL